MKNREPLFLFIVALALYLVTMSISLDDRDGVQFALGIQDFNILRAQPHPPGYPIYILMGKFMFLFTRDEVLALTLTSALFAALSLVAFYYLILEMFDRQTAFYSAAVLGVTPLFWLNGLKAMTDIPAMFFMLVSLLFMYRNTTRKNIHYLYAAAFLTGLAMGIRLHTIFLLLPTLVYCLSKARAKQVATSTSLLVAGSLIWIIPLIAIHGAEKLLGAFLRQFTGRFTNDRVSILGAEFNPVYLWDRLWNFVEYFFLSYGIEPTLGIVILLAVL
ncbi:MAG: glycosyltransferase family 39 protein, partial [Gammaproteobacteria bacterium]|nr:glycosyltransferase family 39 protein [Gammaproteobacteria bacterium]